MHKCVIVSVLLLREDTKKIKIKTLFTSHQSGSNKNSKWPGRELILPHSLQRGKWGKRKGAWTSRPAANLTPLSNHLCTAKKPLFTIWCEHRNRHRWTNQIQTLVSSKRRRRGRQCWEMELWARRITREQARVGPGALTSPSRAVLCIGLEPIYLFTLPQSKTPVGRHLYSPTDARMTATPFQ